MQNVDIDDCASSALVLDNDETYELVCRFTGAQFFKWLSCFFLGAELYYGDEKNQLIFDFLRMVDCPVEICEKIVECLTTNADVQDAVDQFVADQMFLEESHIYQAMVAQVPGFPGQFPQNVSQSEGQLSFDQSDAATNNPTCDFDILWAQCLAVVQTTNRAIVDVLEKVEAASNSVELWDAVSEFPLIGTVKEISGVDMVLDIIQYLQNSISEGYNAQYTEAKEQELACQLFCACQDCEITVQRLYDIFDANLQSHDLDTNGLTTIIEMLQFVTGVTVTGDLVVDLAFFMAWSGVKLGNFLYADAFNLGLQVILALAVNDANNDWVTLCDVCPSTYCDSMAEGLGADTHQPDSTHVFDAYCAESPGSWQTPGGVDDDGYISSQGVSCVFSGDDFYQAEAYYDFGVDVTVTAASMMITNGPAATDAPCQIRLFDSSKSLIGYDDHAGGVGGWHLYEMGTVTGTTSGVRYICWCSVAVGDEAGLDNVCVTWTPD